MERSAFIFNINKCVGCMACVAGCSIENGTAPEMNWREVNGFNTLHHPGLPVFHFSLACNHCEDAPCMKHCPSLAYTRDEKTGAIIHHAEACIGCKYCTWACPYDAPKYNSALGVIEKCTFCIERIETGQKPACTDACPVGALEYGQEVIPKEDLLVPGFVNKSIRPAIRIVPLRETFAPEIWNLDAEKNASKEVNIIEPKPVSKVQLSKEWALVPFTLTVACLVAWFGAHVTIGINLSLIGFLLPGILALALSSMHLGKKLRAWRSILNIRSSWLSREIFSYIAFMGFGSLQLVFPHPIFANLALTFGVFTLFSIDMVYRVFERNDKMLIHSAMVWITGLTIFSILSGISFLIGFSLALKLGLYLFRKIIFLKSKSSFSLILSIVRIGTLIFLLIFLGSGYSLALNGWQILVIIILGEIIDRSEFYHEADVASPGKALFDLLKNNSV